MKKSIQEQYDIIYSFFKTTTEEFDTLEWNGSFLLVILNQKVIEIYTYNNLKELIMNF
jgi:hypothetical protein